MTSRKRVRVDLGRNTVLAFAIACLTALEIVALVEGVDGQLFATVISAIGAMVGYLFGVKTEKK